MAADHRVNVLLYPTSRHLSLWRCHPGWGTAHSWEILRSYRRRRTKALLSSLKRSSWSSRSRRPRRNILETTQERIVILITLLIKDTSRPIVHVRASHKRAKACTWFVTTLQEAEETHVNGLTVHAFHWLQLRTLESQKRADLLCIYSVKCSWILPKMWVMIFK